MKKRLILVLAITIILTLILGINVFGDHFVDTETGLKVQSTNVNLLDDWNKIVLREDNGSFITIKDNSYTSFSLSDDDLININHHISMGDSIIFRFYIKYWEEYDGYQTYTFNINESTNFSTNGYDSKSADGLEYYRGDAGITPAAFYIDDTVTDGEIQYQLSDEKINEKINGYEHIEDAIENLIIQLSAKGKDEDTWHLQYLELQYRIIDESNPEILSGDTYNIDTLEYSLEVDEPVVEYSIDNGKSWYDFDVPAKSTPITLTKGLNEIKVKDQAGNISNSHSFFVNTIEIVNTFDAYSKLYDGTTGVAIYNDSTSITGVHAGHDVYLNKVFSFSNSDVGSNIEVDLRNSILKGTDSDKYLLRLDTAPTNTADIYEKLSWDFESDFSNNQNNTYFDFASYGSTGSAVRVQHQGRNSVKFERVNEQYIKTKNANNFLPAGSDFTYSVWYYIDESVRTIKDLEEPSERYFVIESSGDEKYPLSYGLKYDGNILKGEVFTNNQATPNSFFLSNLSSSYGAETGRWYNIAVTYENSSDTHTAYLNGQESGTMMVPVVEDIEKLILGSYRGENDRFWDGYIDNLSIWGRVLNQSEIIDLQNRNMYTISYDGNGFTSDTLPLDEFYEKNTTFNIPTDNLGLSRDGYIFTGWNTEADGTGDSVSFTVENDTTLYAQWDFIGEFKVSDYGTGDDATYRWYRGYLFQVNQKTTVTSLIGGGNGGVFAGAIYSVDGFTVNADGSINGNINPTEVLGSVEFIGTNPNQVVNLNSKLILQPDTYYLIASGRKSWEGLNQKEDPYYGYGYVVKNIDINYLESECTIINTWLPKSTGTTNNAIQYEYFDAEPISILDKMHSITEDLPMLGFQYTTNVNPPEVETYSPEVTSSSALLKGRLTDTGGGYTGVYFEIGTSMDLSSDGTLYKINSTASASNYTYTLNSLTEDKYYYRAVAVNEASRSEGAIKYFYKPYNITYHLEGGTNNSKNPETTSTTDESLTLFEPTKLGYKFVGWYDAENGGNKVTYISNETSSVDLYARWNLAPLAGFIGTFEESYRRGDTITLKWTASTETEDVEIKYDVDCCTTNTGYEDISDNLTGTSTDFTLPISGAEKIKFRVRAYDGEKYSDFVESEYIKIYYEVTFNDFNGSFITTESGLNITPPSPKREGYTFDKWDSSYTNLTSDKIVTAVYKANSDTEYLVEHYIENLYGNYEQKETENLTGTTDTMATAGAKDYIGFSENTDIQERVASGNIESDGSRVLRLYYKRNKYDIIYNTDGGSSINPDTVKYGKSLIDFVLPSSTSKVGYTFEGWAESLPENMPAKNLTFTAQWLAEEDTKYIVEHYQQNIDDSGYTLKESYILGGETESTVTASALTYDGFYFDEDNTSNKTSGEIIDDGSLVLKLYYNREEYTVTFLNHENELLKTETVRYQGSATPPPRPSRTGYDFRRWSEGYTYVTSDVVTKATYRKEEPEPVVQETEVTVEGEEEVLGTETSLEVDGEITVSYEVENDTVEKIINASEDSEEKTLEVPIKTTDPKKVTSKLAGDIVKKLEENDFIINIKTEIAEYEIPAEEITIINVAKELGVEETSLKKIEIDIEINKVSPYYKLKAFNIGREEGYRVLITPIEFKVKAKTTSTTGEEKEVEIKEFKKYVARRIPLPEDVDPNKITTAVLIEEDGSTVHIPTEVYQIDRKWYVEVNSLTNSKYTLINNEKTVKNAENHWSKEAVDDLASRKVIEDIYYFTPDADISRGEFAEYITKSLGIYRDNISGVNSFKDVEESNKVYDAVETASRYEIVNGYPDGRFRPEESITRQEAMIMYARAIKIADLKDLDLERVENYKDIEEVSYWAYEEVKTTLGAGVFNGRNEDTIAPKGTLTKAEAATALRNLLIKAGLINE